VSSRVARLAAPPGESKIQTVSVGMSSPP